MNLTDDIHQSGKVANISRRNEFELYDEKSKMERKKEAATISSIEDPHFTDPEEGTLVLYCTFVLSKSTFYKGYLRTYLRWHCF